MKVKLKVVQSCPILCNPKDCIVHGILQARILEWVAFPFSRGSSKLRDQTQISCIAGDSLPAEPQGKPKNTGMGSLYPGKELRSPALKADTLPTELSGKPINIPDIITGRLFYQFCIYVNQSSIKYLSRREGNLKLISSIPKYF